MEKSVYDDEESSAKELISEEEDVDSPDEGFSKGYAEEEEVTECAECGTAVREEKKVAKKIDGESYVFCSKTCAEDFQDSLGEE